MGLPYLYESLSHSSDGSDDFVIPRPPPSRSSFVVRVACLISSHLCALLLGITIYRALMEGSSMTATAPLETSQGSPLPVKVWSAVPADLNEYSKVMKRNGSVNFPSIYRGRGPEVDRAWEDLVNVGYIHLPVSEEQVAALGVDTNTAATLPPKQGGGYAFVLETYHQLHCVDLLRKVTHWNFPWYQENTDDDSFKYPDDHFRSHVDHCLEMLRQTLMCHADTTMIFTHWVSVREKPWPDFNTRHQCRNFDKVHAWAKSHELVDQTIPRRPEGALALAVPP